MSQFPSNQSRSRFRNVPHLATFSEAAEVSTDTEPHSSPPENLVLNPPCAGLRSFTVCLENARDLELSFSHDV